jgi:hypothetical protein
MRSTELRWQLLDCLADDFQAANKGTSKRLVHVETLVDEPLAVVDQELRLGQDVAQVLTRGLISASMACRR